MANEIHLKIWEKANTEQMDGKPEADKYSTYILELPGSCHARSNFSPTSITEKPVQIELVKKTVSVCP
jgi:hypothetical protein